MNAGTGAAPDPDGAAAGSRPPAQEVPMTEYLSIGASDRRWHCRRCQHDLGPAQRSYKEGCLIADRDGVYDEIYGAFNEAMTAGLRRERKS